MSQSLRAVYKHGQFCLLDPGHFTEGQEVLLLVLSDEERVDAALSGLLVPMPEPQEEESNEEVLMQEIDESLRGQVPLSEIIIAERHEGP